MNFFNIINNSNDFICSFWLQLKWNPYPHGYSTTCNIERFWNDVSICIHVCPTSICSLAVCLPKSTIFIKDTLAKRKTESIVTLVCQRSRNSTRRDMNRLPQPSAYWFTDIDVFWGKVRGRNSYVLSDFQWVDETEGSLSSSVGGVPQNLFWCLRDQLNIIYTYEFVSYWFCLFLVDIINTSC